MPRDPGARDLQAVFSRAPWRSRLLFYLGVFCCFAPVGLLKEMQTLGAAPTSYLVAQGVFSGVLAVSWAACAIHVRRWLPLLIVVTIVAFFGLRNLFPPPALPDHLSSEAIVSLKARLTCVDSKQLDESFSGRAFNAQLLADLPGKTDPCGENGEFHTFCCAGPMFDRQINVSVGEIVNRDGFVFADILESQGA